ncbi:MAG: PDZ domain-containing protein [bacterium]|nr:PDZ domain-containing protein [bacterium]
MSSPGKKHVTLFFVMLLLVLAGVGAGLQRTVMAFDEFDEGLRKIKLLTSVLVTIQENYVDEDKVKTEDLINGAIHGMLSTLDRYSVYMEPDEAKEFNDQTQGQFGGLGIQIDVVDGWLTVVEPLPGTPAAEAGLTSGDKIVEIEGENTKNISIYEAIKRLKGEPGSQVTITVARQGEADLFKRTITRAIIKTKAVEDKEIKMLDDHVGYIRLRDFTRDAAEELEAGIRQLQGQGMDALILDLRDNVGGLLDVAVKICDLFIPKGQVIVSHRANRKGDPNERVYTAQRDTMGDFLVAVLVNEFSASASEIVAGCIQDHARGVIVGPVGHRTFGKGSVQTLMENKELQGGALKLTTAKYYTPSGRSIMDDNGLLPDVFAQVTDEQRIEIRRAGRVSEMPTIDGDKAISGRVMEKNMEEQQATHELTVEEVFTKQDEKSEAELKKEKLYDVELFTAYQCLKGAAVMKNGAKKNYNVANSGN